jgi:UDP-2,3-diacylglucosamine pyrophosphatase LpxH
MNLICNNVKVKDNYRISCLGDVHFGSKECDEKLFKDKVEWISKQKDLGVILMGDLINAGTRASVGAGNYDDDYNPQEQYEKVLDILYPIKEKVLFTLQGNHEQRIYDLSSFDVTKMLSRELGVTYAKDGIGILKQRVNDQNYIVTATHGSTGAATVMGKMNGCLKLANYIDADIYCMGHVHALAHNVELYRRINLKNKMIEEKERHFVLTGSFLDWDSSYGERKGYSPMKKGMPTIHLRGSKFDVQVEM